MLPGYTLTLSCVKAAGSWEDVYRQGARRRRRRRRRQTGQAWKIASKNTWLERYAIFINASYDGGHVMNVDEDWRAAWRGSTCAVRGNISWGRDNATSEPTVPAACSGRGTNLALIPLFLMPPRSCRSVVRGVVGVATLSNMFPLVRFVAQVYVCVCVDPLSSGKKNITIITC